MTAPRGKPLPQPTPETAPYWEGCKQHELRLQFCNECRQFFFYPRIFCPKCLSDNVEWRAVSGKGTLLTYVLSARPAPGFENEVPYAIAIVKLDEGPHLMTNIVNAEMKPEALPAGMPVEVVFEDVNENISIPKFQPAGAGRSG
ncbi:MAG TPA: Zn-ribbon domain-containing OB-fold protein [Dehalococcoidia bacterium]|nr:Zn-ribbon domain-containing OB-fold protein [Dehalococcoidia bacterium]